jgi:putative hemolysin
MQLGPAAFVALFACLALSFLFSGMEAGVFALSRLRIRSSMRTGSRRAQLLHEYLQHPEHFLWTILIGNTLATFTAFSLIAVALYQWLHGYPLLFVVSFLVVAFFFYVFFDLLPKMLFRLFPNRLCLWLAVPFRFIHLGLSPLTQLITWFSESLLRLTGGKSFTGNLFGNRSELRMIMQESAHSLTSEERVMVNRVLDLQNLLVGSIAVPLDKVVSVSDQTTIRQLFLLCSERLFTRLPVWRDEGKSRRIVGIVSLRDLLYRDDVDPERTAGAFVKPALYLREDLRLEEALRRMQRSGQRLAVVLKPDNQELGIISIQDILKVIFGEVSL